MAGSRKKHIVILISTIVGVLLLYPYETTVVPAWRLRIKDVDGNVCREMPAMQTWGHYSLFLIGSIGSEDRISDQNGFVEFPERKVRATGLRRVVMPVITHIMLIAHGSVGASGTVHLSGLKKVAWLSYKEGLPVPELAEVERCITRSDLRPKSLN